MTRNFTPVADLMALKNLYEVMRREQFTIVHTHTPKPGLLGQLAARMAGVPIIVNTLHGFYFHDHMPEVLAALLHHDRKDCRALLPLPSCRKTAKTSKPRYVKRFAVLSRSTFWAMASMCSALIERSWMPTC